MKPSASENIPGRRTGRPFLWSLVAVFVGMGATGLLVAQTLLPAEGPEPSPVAGEVPSAEASPAPADAAPAPVGRTISLTAADLIQAGESDPGTRATLFSQDNVEVPAEAEGKTVADAVDEIARAAGRRLEYLATNVVDALQDPYKAPVKTSVASYSDLLRQLLPAGYASWAHDDGAFLFVGTDADVNRKRTDYAIESLANNHTRIAFGANDMTVYDAVRRIKVLSHANINYDWMDARDKITETVSDDSRQFNASDLGGTNAVPDCARTSFNTEGVEMEWRTVLRGVLGPAGYEFDELDGEVRVATRERFEAMRKRDRDARPMGLRYVRVYHANPEEIVERLKPMGITQNSKASIQVAPYQEKSKTDNVNSYRHNLSSASSRLSVGGTALGDTSSNSSGSWGNLLRPKNPPAILVYDNEENLDRIEALIRTMDIREKQVLIEALILDLTDAGSRNLGMKLEDMGFSNVPLLGVSWTQEHDVKNHNDHQHSWKGSSGEGYNSYLGRSSGTSDGKSKQKDTTTILGADGTTIFSYDTPTEEEDGIPRTWAKGNVRESYNGRKWENTYSYDKSSSSLRNRNWSTVLGPLDFKFVLEMVETKGNGKLLSSPVLTIGDHSEAMLHVGNVTPILNIETEVTSSTTSVVTEDIEWQELVTGVLMWVGPEVSEDGKSVRLWVHPKISEVTGEWETYRETRYPHLTSQEMDTRVTVPTGCTLLMGGLTRVEKSETLRKVPLLGDIPFLGRLFRHTSTSSSQRNLVILIRPTILDDEKPDTGFETPANAIIDPMMATSGRNLQDVVFKEEDDKMKQREKALRKTLGWDKAEEEAETGTPDVPAAPATPAAAVPAEAGSAAPLSGDEAPAAPGSAAAAPIEPPPAVFEPLPAGTTEGAAE